MKLTTTMVAVASVFVCAQSAQARSTHHRNVNHHEVRRQIFARHYLTEQRSRSWDRQSYAFSAQGTYGRSDWQQPYAYSAQAGYGRTERQPHVRPARVAYRQAEWQASNDLAQRGYHGGLGGRPAAWCGWEMRQLVGGDPGPSYNLARNWAHWGHSGPAGVGAVVVWSHHVGKIVGQQNGKWLVKSGNDGNRVRTRPLPIGGAIAIRWG